MSGRHLALLVVLSLGLPLLGIAQSPSGDVVVRVHLIHAKTARPIPNEPIRIWRLVPSKPGPGSTMDERTDRDGVATFRLAAPAPKRILVGPLPRWNARWGVCGRWEFAVSEIIERGVSGGSRGGWCPPRVANVGSGFRPRPGDVYIFATRINLWQRPWGPFDR